MNKTLSEDMKMALTLRQVVLLLEKILSLSRLTSCFFRVPPVPFRNPSNPWMMFPPEFEVSLRYDLSKAYRLDSIDA